MRNLKLTYKHVKSTNLRSDIISELDNIFSLVIDEDHFCFYANEKVYCFTSKGDLEPILHLDSIGIVDPQLVGFGFCNVTNKIILAYSCGSLFTLDISLKSPKPKAEKQYTDSIEFINLSPDNEILTLITSRDTLTLLTCRFSIISSELKLKLPPVQKSAANATSLSTEDSRPDDVRLEISWNKANTQFAIYILSTDSRIVKFQIFDRTGILKCTVSLSTTLEVNLPWGPSTSEIAATYNFASKQISYFKENGTNCIDSTSSFEPEKILVKNLQWSTDTNVLAVWCVNLTDQTSRIQLWTENNNHWYLKQTLSFPNDNPVLYHSWAPYLKLYVLTAKLFLTYKFVWTLSHSKGINETDKGLVGVVDGNRALLTSFRRAVLQPPMAHQVLYSGEPVNEVVFAPGISNEESWINSNVLFTVLHNNQLAFYKQESKFVEYGYIRSYEIEWEITKPVILESIPYAMHNFLWYKEDTILCALAGDEHHLLCVIHMEGIGLRNNGRLIVRNTYTIDGCITDTVCSPDQNTVYIMANEILTYSGDHIQKTNISRPAISEQVELIEVDNQPIIVWLAGNSLYFNGKQIVESITSYFVHARFLLLTTCRNTLISISLDTDDFLNKLTNNLSVKPEGGLDDVKFLSGLSITNVEKNSKLIISVARNMRTILQINNKKLMCVEPIVQFEYIVAYLNELNYRAAFDLMLKQKINLNVIFDHDPDLFIGNITRFIGSLKDPNLLNLFISNLQDEDVTTTIYSKYYPRRTLDDNTLNQIPNSANNSSISSGKYAGNFLPSKAKYVCDILRNCMEARPDASRFLLPIMTSMVKNHTTKDLEEALKKVKAFGTLESENKSLAYLFQSVDADLLFDAALGMYDFELAKLIAIKSGKDSAEYVPFLNSSITLDVNYTRFLVNVYLKRYETALGLISKCEEKFAECMDLIRSQNLYSHALTLYNTYSKQYQQIAEAYGDDLMARRRFQEAGVMYTRSNHLAKGFNAYKLAGEWREAIIVAKELKFESTDLLRMYEDLAAQLKDSEKYGDAAIVLIDYLNKPEEAVAVLCQGRLWQDAFRSARQAKRPDIIDNWIKPGVQKQADEMISKIAKNQADFIRYKKKLNAIGTRKFPEGATTSQRFESLRCSREEHGPNKKRRRIDGNLDGLEKDNLDEDLTLRNALQKIVTITYADKAEVDSLVITLLHLYNDTSAENLRKSMEGLLNKIEESKGEITDLYK